MSLTFDLKSRLAEMGISPKKAFGQNFLVNAHVIGKIIEATRSQFAKDLIEVGPGLGALTEPLLLAGFKPRLLELDPELAEYWRCRKLEVIEGDALKVDWNQLHLNDPSMLVSNLPYQISTHLVVERCFGPIALKWMVLMFQKEVAQRLMAEPRTKEYGTLSVMTQLHFKMRKVTDAAPGDFFPAPKVSSRVLFFERQNVQGLGPAFLKFVKGGFAFRRKFLLKNLKGVVDKPTMALLPQIFEQHGLSAKARAEELTPPQFERLFKALHEHKDHRRK